MDRKVVLTGTTGKLGSLILKHVLELFPPSAIIVSLYNPSKTPESYPKLGLDVRRGDYADPTSLDAAYEGAHLLYLMSHPSIDFDVRVKAHVNAIEAAKRTGMIKHIVYASVSFAGGPEGSESAAAVMQSHLATEAHLRSTLPPDMTYTILRKSVYSESAPWILGVYDITTIPAEVYIPPGENDGLLAFSKRDELAEASAKIIAALVGRTEGHLMSSDFTNKTILLAAEPKHSLTSVAALITNISGKPEPIKVKRVSAEEYAAPGSRASEYVGSPEMARDWATTYQAIGKGQLSYRGPGSRELERIIGRVPERLENTLEVMLKVKI